jgi:NAD+ synthase (glutamine-hydrolysing)
VGDLEGNTGLILDRIAEAKNLHADLVAFPELVLTGYPPEDLLLKPGFIRRNTEQLQSIARQTHDITAVVGYVEADGTDTYNAAAVIHNGQVAHSYRKIFLPNYGVFDEERYFRAGTDAPVYLIGGVRVGINICEDIWYPSGPTAAQRAAGAEIIININGSPYHRGRRDLRQTMLATRAMDHGVVVAYVNTVGGQDELVFDGSSMVLDQSGRLLAEGKQFQEDMLALDVDVDAVFSHRLRDPRARREPNAGRERFPAPVFLVSNAPEEQAVKARLPRRPAWTPLDPVAEVHDALVLGTRDYVRKSGFTKVLIGLSGGVDSALTAAIAVEALGRENVTGVTMPSDYSSEGSITDSKLLADNLGIPCHVIPIKVAFTAYKDTLRDIFTGTEEGLTEENLQARIRGNILMAMSNKFGWLVLITANKSETATGYSTLYGDMAGGFAVLKDVPKTLVYEVAEHINRTAGRDVIPRTTIEKAPSAELRPNQKDEDSLPPYPVLDPILQLYVEEDRSPEEIIALGHPEEAVRRAVTLVDRSEYKRRQAPPGVRISPRAFGRDRRLPIVNRFSPY